MDGVSEAAVERGGMADSSLEPGATQTRNVRGGAGFQEVSQFELLPLRREKEITARRFLSLLVGLCALVVIFTIHVELPPDLTLYRIHSSADRDS